MYHHTNMKMALKIAILLLPIFLVINSNQADTYYRAEAGNEIIIVDENDSIMTDDNFSFKCDKSTEIFQLPKNYTYEDFYRAPLNGLQRITISGNKSIFVQYINNKGNNRVSLLDPDKEILTKVIDLDSWPTSFIIGGPSDTFFLEVDAEIRQYSKNGSYSIWGKASDMSAPYYYSPDGKMIGLDMNQIYEIKPDGSTTILATGFSEAMDVVTDAQDNIYVTDIGNGELVKIDASGTKTVLTKILPDAAHLGFDPSGNLYGTNFGGEGIFVRIDTETGELTFLGGEENLCYILFPSDFVFDKRNRVIFASWVSCNISVYNLKTSKGKVLFNKKFENTHLADIGPDNMLYMVVHDCSSSGNSSKIMRFQPDGTVKKYLTTQGDISNMCIDPSGGIFISLSTDAGYGIYYIKPGTKNLTLIPDTSQEEYTTFDVNPLTGNVFAFIFQENESKSVIKEFSLAGYVKTYKIRYRRKVIGPKLAFDPNGKMFVMAFEKRRYLTGPVVKRWIFKVNLKQGSTKIFAQVNLKRCCPFINFSIDFEGYIWWILNPDFNLYRISPKGKAKHFSCNTPIDAAYVLHKLNRDILIIYPGGIIRVYKSDS